VSRRWRVRGVDPVSGTNTLTCLILTIVSAAPSDRSGKRIRWS
jgi:hypothetical protein